MSRPDDLTKRGSDRLTGRMVESVVREHEDWLVALELKVRELEIIVEKSRKRGGVVPGE